MDAPVVDASALLAFLLEKPGGDALEQLDVFHVSTVNWAEVLQFAPPKVDTDSLLGAFQAFGMALHPFDEDHAALAAHLHNDPALRRLGFADRACFALARHLDVAVWTADQAWREADAGVDVQIIR